MPLTYSNIASLIDARIVENTNQEISATYLHEILKEILEYANEHDILASRIDSSLARVSDMNTAITTATNNLEANIKGNVAPAGNTLEKLHDLIIALTPGTPVDPIPSGLICMWSGTIADIPNGWKLCDGQSGTPNLKGKFVVGYIDGNPSGEYGQIANIGGDAKYKLYKHHIPKHTHSAESSDATIWIENSGDHDHSTNASQKGSETFKAGAGVNKTLNNYFGSNASTTGTAKHDHVNSSFKGVVGNGNNGLGDEGSTTEIDNRPPYFVLAYIIKE